MHDEKANSATVFYRSDGGQYRIRPPHDGFARSLRLATHSFASLGPFGLICGGPPKVCSGTHYGVPPLHWFRIRYCCDFENKLFFFASEFLCFLHDLVGNTGFELVTFPTSRGRSSQLS